MQEEVLKKVIGNGMDIFLFLIEKISEIEEESADEVRRKGDKLALAAGMIVETLRPSFEIAPSLFPDREIQKDIDKMLKFKEIMHSSESKEIKA